MTEPIYVRMEDEFMSGWGMAEGKTNVLVIECDTLEQAQQIEKAGKRRPEMKGVRIVTTEPKGAQHVLYSRKHFNDMGGCWLED